MTEKIAQIPGVLDVTDDLEIKNPQMTVEIDREKAAVYGIGADQIRNQLFNAFGSRQIGTIFKSSNDYQIILEAQPRFRVDPSDLSKVYLKTANNQTIPLDAVAKMVPTVGPLHDQPPGPAALGDDLVQSRARRVARLRGRQDHGGRAHLEHAGDDRERLLRHRAGVPGRAARAGHPGACRRVRRLRHPRHSLRKLRASDHDHLRPAVGRHRRDPDA